MAKPRMRLIVEAARMLADGAGEDELRAYVLQEGEEDADADDVIQAARNRLGQDRGRARALDERPPKLPLRCWTIRRTLPVIVLLAAAFSVTLLVAISPGNGEGRYFLIPTLLGGVLFLWVLLHPIYLQVDEREAVLRWLFWRKAIPCDQIRSVQVDMQTIESQHKLKNVHLYSTYTTWFWVEIVSTAGRSLRVRVNGDMPSQVRSWARFMGFGTQLNELEDRVLEYNADPDLPLE